MGVYVPRITQSRITTISESMSLTEWLKKNAPLENQDKMKANHQLSVYLVTGDDHANQWRSTNLNQNGNMPQYGIRCVVG